MIITLPITKAREELASLVDDAKNKLSEFVITVNGAPAAVLLSAAEYDSWKETMDILSDKKLMKDMREGEKDIKDGKVHDWKNVKKELGWDVSAKNNHKSKSAA